MLVEPSATTVALAQAKLTVAPLRFEQGRYVGSYSLKVNPYFFKNEVGALALSASDQTLRTIADGKPTAFAGTATNNKNGRTKLITGELTPKTPDAGAVTFSVNTDNGLMVFNTKYHFEHD